MTDKKFTDEEIVKALECCQSVAMDDCDGCPYSGLGQSLTDGGGYKSCCNFLLEDALSLIDRKQSGWISVEERLPDENGRFLTVDEKGDMMVCFWEKHFGWFAMVCNKNAITHWMPLPEPPKGD